MIFLFFVWIFFLCVFSVALCMLIGYRAFSMKRDTQQLTYRTANKKKITTNWPMVSSLHTGGGPRTYRNCGVKLQDRLFTPSQQCGSIKHAAHNSITMAIWTGTAYLATRHAHGFLSLAASAVGLGPSSGSGSAYGTPTNFAFPLSFCCCSVSVLLEFVRRRWLRCLLKWNL